MFRIASTIVMCLSVMTLAVSTFAQVDAERAGRIRAAAPGKASAAPKKARTVLIWNTPPALMDQDPHKGYCIPFGEFAFRTLGEKSGAFKAVVSGDLAMLAPAVIKQFDAIVMNNSSGPWIQPLEADMPRLASLGSDLQNVEKRLRKSLMDYVAHGGGLVACHFAIGANPQWPEFHQLLGAKFTGHPWNEEVGVSNEEPGSPLLAAFGGKGFRVADEIYQFGEPYSRNKVRVLLSLDTKTTNMSVKWIDRKDGDFALAWVKQHGDGRVFYCALGHRTEIWWNPAILRFYLDGIQFAVGDLDAAIKPR